MGTWILNCFAFSLAETIAQAIPPMPGANLVSWDCSCSRRSGPVTYHPLHDSIPLTGNRPKFCTTHTTSTGWNNACLY
ncbi:hypothetical protein DER44DRAFT_777724 [Fusarium oxysporum]|nr:hypothetical protein DER44DRAFT_777724 [Fusarium oxysporum]